MGKDYFYHPENELRKSAKTQDLIKNPIAKNPEKYAHARDVLTRDTALRAFHAKLETIKTDTVRKMGRLSTRDEHESDDYLAGRLNTAMSLLEEIDLTIKAGNQAAQMITDKENKKN